ncbi:MAG: sugar kinase [Trueperaceae bacterium]|nr:sugar kinase [Trueperaceae bacterium]
MHADGGSARTEGARQLDVLGLGEPMLEFNETAEPGGGGPRYLQGFGGDTSNAVIAAARQGAAAGYWTRLGQDVFGDRFMQLWAAEGVDAGHVARDPDAPTGIYFVTHGPAGHAFSYYRRGSAASRMRPSDVPLAAIAAARVLHVSGISQAISAGACDTVFAAIEAARSAGAAVSYDTNLRLKLWPLARARAVAMETVAQCDVCLPSLEDATQLTGLEDPDAVVDALLGRGARVVALKLGPDGALVADGHERHRLAGHAVATVDATGAGDTFDGAFLAEWVRGASLAEAGRYANAAAALSTRGYGAVGPIPRRDEVGAWLAARG